MRWDEEERSQRPFLGYVKGGAPHALTGRRRGIYYTDVLHAENALSSVTVSRDYQVGLLIPRSKAFRVSDTSQGWKLNTLTTRHRAVTR